MNPRHASAAAILATLAGTACGQPTEPFPAQFQLSSLLPSGGGDGSNGFVIHGITSYDNCGRSVSSAGDINGDGFDDVIIGAHYADPNANPHAGESYVVFGGSALIASGVIELSSLNGSNGFVLNGIDSGDRSGLSVSSAGDVNNDGFDDLIVGANRASPNGITSGESYVVFGATDVGATGVIELSGLNGSNGFVLNGALAGDLAGNSVSAAGDLNDDGIDDLLVGARGSDPNGNSQAGSTYVVFGVTGLGSGGVLELSSINGSNGFVLHGIDEIDRSAKVVSSAGDLNGDGVGDLVIAATLADPNGIDGAGECYVVFGGSGVGSGGVIELSGLNGSNGFVLNGIDVDDYCGTSVSTAGDVNGDGFDDLVIGAHRADPNGNSYAGESYVVFGGAGLGSGGVIELSSLNGSNGFVLNGIGPNDISGFSVSSAGDMNNDGIADLIIGAMGGDPNGNAQAGESSVLFGGVGLGAGGVMELSSLNGTNGFVLDGIDASDYSGFSVASVGDVNGDGIADLIIGAPDASPNGNTEAGECYVVFGRSNANVWVNPAGGGFDTGSNWQSGVVPIGGLVTIDMPIGVTVTVPPSAVLLDQLNLGAGLGRTTLDLQPFSLVSVMQPMSLPSLTAISGAGTFLSNGLFSSSGLVLMDGMSLLTPAGFTNQAGAELSMTTGLIEGDVVNEADATLSVIQGVIDGSLSNSGEVLISSAGTGSASVHLQINSSLTNELDGEVVLRGDAHLDAPGGIENTGTLSIAFATADVLAPVHNINHPFVPGSALGASGVFELSSIDGNNGFVIQGVSNVDWSGQSVSSIGDVNGDGIDDLIIGVYSGDPGDPVRGNAGESYVVFGGASLGAGGAIELSTLDGSNGFVLNGIDSSDLCGFSVSGAGDVNGDGIDDLIIGARYADPNSNASAGESYVVFGGVGVGASGVIELSSLIGTNGFVLNGIDAGDSSGVSVSSAGDVNNDGYFDVIIGAKQAAPNGLNRAGESYVVFGGPTVGAGGVIELASLNGSNGFVLNGIDESDETGISVSSVSDFNGDGIDDLIIGAYGADPNGYSGAGESYVVFGGTGVGAGGVIELSTLDGSNGFVLNGVFANSRSGSSVSDAGDVNADGIADLIIGAYLASPNGNFQAGQSSVVFGAVGVGSGGTFELSSLNGSNGFVINGIDEIDFSGHTVSGAGDVNGDGIDDLVIGAERADPHGNNFSGESYVVFGGVGIGSGGAIELSSLNGTDGFVLHGINESDASGRGVSGAGDVNGDGIDDLIIAAYGADPNGTTNAGEIYVVFGDAGVTAPPALISISGASSALLTDDVINETSIVLTDDSSLVILGTLFGNGVSGPGGAGTAGSVYIEGGVVPGVPLQSLALSQFDGDLDLGPTAHTIIEIGGTAPGIDLDQLASAQNLGAGGTLEVRLVNGYVPQPGDEYQVLSFATASGAFTSIVLDPGLIAADANTTELLITGRILLPDPCLPDLNGDGFLDNGDIGAFIAFFLAGDFVADMNGDGFLDNGDIGTFIALFLAGC